MKDKILVDIACLSRGIPPISLGAQKSLEMMRSLSPKEKRVTSRKIKKIVRLHINRIVSKIEDEEARKIKKILLLNHLNLGPTKKPYQKLFTLRRLNFVKAYMEELVT